MSSHAPPARKRVTIHELRRMKEAGERIAVVTAYDATAARLVDAAGFWDFLDGMTFRARRMNP